MTAFLAFLGRPKTGCILLVAIVLLVFGGATLHEATLDSRHFLLEDPRVGELRMGEIFTQGYWNVDRDDPSVAHGQADLYRPLTLAWMALLWKPANDEQRANVRPALLNFGNVALHAGGTALRFLLILALFAGRPHAGALAFFAALLLGLHPAAVEVVGTQVGASEGLAVVLSTLALLCWHAWQTKGGIARAAGFGVFLFLGLLAKENVVAIAALAPIGTVVLLRKRFGDLARVTFVAFIPVAVFFAIRHAIFGSFVGVGDPVLAGFPPSSALAMAIAAIGSYDLMALFWPFRLLAVVGHQNLWPPEGVADARVLLGILVLAAVAGGCVISLRKSRTVLFWLLFFILTFLPTSNLIVNIGALAATRFLYLPLTGLAVLCAVAAERLSRAERSGLRGLAPVVVAATLLVSLTASIRELPVWKNEVALYTAMAERADDAFGAGNLGVALQQQADRADQAKNKALGDSLRDRALAAFESAAKSPRPLIPGTTLVPEDVLEAAFKSTFNAALGHAQWKKNLERARGCATSAREIARQGGSQGAAVSSTTHWGPLEADAESLLGNLSAALAASLPTGATRSQRFAEAERHFARAREIQPENFRVEEESAKLLGMQGDTAGMKKAFEALYVRARPEVRRLSAALQAVHHFGDFLEQQGDKVRAARVVLEAMIEGQNRIADADGFFTYGQKGLATQDAATHKLARESLAIFLRRANARHAAQVQEARRLLAAP